MINDFVLTFHVKKKIVEKYFCAKSDLHYSDLKTTIFFY